MMHWTYLVLAIVLAIIAAKILVQGGVALGHKLGIPQFVIGAVVIGFGSSMPEFSVNIGAAIKGSTGLAIGNILGSNIFNIAFILGVVALIKPLPVGSDSKVKDLPMHLIAAVVIAVCGNQLYLDHIDHHELMMSHGIILLCFFCIYLYYTLLEVFDESPYKKPLHRSQHRSVHKEVELSTAMIPFYILAGLAGLVWSGDMIVEQAVVIAEEMKLGDDLIGLLIVGPGTSMPEFIACLVALYQRNTDMVIGNIIGSNLFNIFFTLGVSSIITPLPLDLELNKIILVNIALALFVLLSVWLSRDRVINRFSGGVLLLAYGGYIYLAL